MRKMRERLFVIAVIAVFAWWMYLPFSQPSLTSIQLLLTFWRQYVIGISIMIVTAVIALYDA